MSKKQIKNFIILLGMCMMMTLCAYTVYAADEPAVPEKAAAEDEGPFGKKIGITVGLNYMSDFFWRGYDVYGKGQGVVFPFINYSIFGIEVGYNGEYSEQMFGDGPDRENHPGQYIDNGADFHVAYSYTIPKILTVGASGLFIWYYASPDRNKEINDTNYNDSFFIGTVFVQGDFLLSPKLSYSHDLHVDDNDGTKERFQDFYINLSISHTFQLTKEASVSLSGGVGYFNNQYGVEKSKTNRGVSDITAACNFSVNKYGVALTAGLNYALVPNQNWRDSESEWHRYWSTFGASYSF